MASEYCESLPSDFTFISVPMPRNPGDTTVGEPTPGSSVFQSCLSPGQSVWDANTGKSVVAKEKRKLTKAQRGDSKVIRGLGGQCWRCRMSKRKVGVPLAAYFCHDFSFLQVSSFAPSRSFRSQHRVVPSEYSFELNVFMGGYFAGKTASRPAETSVCSTIWP